MQYNAKAIGISTCDNNMVMIKFLVSRIWFRRCSNNTPGRVPQGWHVSNKNNVGTKMGSRD